MKSIAYIVAYFGELPALFPLWLNSCRNNPTIDWFIFTDDRRDFDYPKNVYVNYTSFENLKNLVQSRFEYEINLYRPYKLCDYKIAYGDIFSDYIKGYDFWGFCDIDLLWGDIRHFLTDEVLSKYDKVGFQGHSTLVRNNEFYKSFYKKGLKNGCSFKDIATMHDNCIADEKYFNQLFAENRIHFYQEFTFANLSPFVYNFRINYLPAKWNDRNKYFVFEYMAGTLNRVAVVNDKIYRDEYMYVHFLKRSMEVCIESNDNNYLIVPNKLIPYEDLGVNKIISYNKPHYLKFFISHFIENAYKLKWSTIFPILKTKIRGYYRLLFRSDRVRY